MSLFIRAKQIYDSGILGNITDITAIFHVGGSPDPTDIRMQYETGGGVTMELSSTSPI